MRDQGTRPNDLPSLEELLPLLLGPPGSITQLDAVSRAGALLTTICRMTTDPAAAMRFAIAMLQQRLESIGEPVHPVPAGQA